MQYLLLKESSPQTFAIIHMKMATPGTDVTRVLNAEGKSLLTDVG